MNFPIRLRAVLEFKNLKIKEFSDLTGIPYSSCQSYLNGTRDPGMEVLTTICLQLYVNLNWLLTGQGEMFISTTESTLSRQEQKLLEDYRESNEQGKEAIEKTAKALSAVATLTGGKVA